MLTATATTTGTGAQISAANSLRVGESGHFDRSALDIMAGMRFYKIKGMDSFTFCRTNNGRRAYEEYSTIIKLHPQLFKGHPRFLSVTANGKIDIASDRARLQGHIERINALNACIDDAIQNKTKCKASIDNMVERLKGEIVIRVALERQIKADLSMVGRQHIGVEQDLGKGCIRITRVNGRTHYAYRKYLTGEWLGFRSITPIIVLAKREAQ